MTDTNGFSNATIEATIVFTGLTIDQVNEIVRKAADAVDRLRGQIDADVTMLCTQCERAIIPPEDARPNDAGEPICGNCELTNFIEEQNEELDQEFTLDEP